jgi:hypothetical protein
VPDREPSRHVGRAGDPGPVLRTRERLDDPYLSPRIGRVIFNIEDREALYSLAEMVKEAQDLTEHTFGPEWVRGR